MRAASAGERILLREFDLIRRIRERCPIRSRDLTVGIGDDAAVWQNAAGAETLLTTDLLIEDVHFRLRDTTPELLGKKALAVNLSDIAAMGGRPRFVTLSLAIPAGMSVDFLDRFVDGLLEDCLQFQVELAGGDVSSSPSGFMVSITAIGAVATGCAVRRSGARAGDRVMVSGELGASVAGLKLLESGHRLGASGGGPEAQHIQNAIRSHLCPRPRLELGAALREKKLATAMIDISDGLSSDLGHIVDESRVGTIINFESIPCSPALALLGEGARDLVLHSGEDYELLFTVKRERVSEVLALDRDIRQIGEIVSESGMWLKEGSHLVPLSPKGFEHEWDDQARK